MNFLLGGRKLLEVKNSAIYFSDLNAQRIENDDYGGGQIVRERERKWVNDRKKGKQKIIKINF